MTFLITLLSFIFVFGIVVFVHEGGHFLMARRAGVGVREFALGFGPKIYRRKFHETDFSIGLLPLGGFVRVMGLDDTEDEKGKKIPKKLDYNQKSMIDRLLIVAGGPIMNLVLSIVVFFALFAVIGTPSGVSNKVQLVVGDSPAAKAGIQNGDIFLEVNGRPITDMKKIIEEVIWVNKGQALKFLIQRGDQKIEREIVPIFREESGRALMGVQFSSSQYTRINPWDALKLSLKKTFDFSKDVIESLRLLVSGKESVSALSGPLGIAKMSGEIAKGGFYPLLNWIAVISIYLGIFNLLPLPALDGGRIVFLGYEAIFRRKPNANIENWIHMVGFVLLLGMMVLVTVFNDLPKLF
jgi:regulator of sigma E protease